MAGDELVFKLTAAVFSRFVFSLPIKILFVESKFASEKNAIAELEQNHPILGLKLFHSQ